MANEKRLIDANALNTLENLDYDYAPVRDGCAWYRAADVWSCIEQEPTVDAVEVVRCKDCKHYKPQNQGVHRNCTTPYCMRVVAVKVSPDDFCSYGERREGE